MSLEMLITSEKPALNCETFHSYSTVFPAVLEINISHEF